MFYSQRAFFAFDSRITEVFETKEITHLKIMWKYISQIVFQIDLSTDNFNLKRQIRFVFHLD